MSTVRVYKSTDPGAPPHPSALRGSMAALLRACLVVGYGSGVDAKAPAGWEEPFAELGNIACFRATEGARQFYQIDDTQANANAAILRGFESMSSVSTGQGGWGEKYFGKRSTANGSSVWWVIADEKTVYVFLDTTQGLTGHVMGEYRSFLDDDPYNSLVCGHVTAGGLYTIANTSVNAAGAVIFMMPTKKITDTFSATLTSFGDGRGHNKTGVATLSPTGITTPNAFINGAVQFPAVAGMSYPVVTPLIVNGSNGSVCGRYRGVYCPLAFRPKTHGTPFALEGKTFLPLNLGYGTGGDTHGQVWMDITGSWEG